MTSDLLEENQELRKRNTELQEEIAELRNNGFTVSAMTEQQLKVALEKGEQLEKENAELKEKLKKKFDEWIKENGGTSGVLYQTFSDDELEHIFMSAYEKNNR
jgi:cell division septum initiation protein DivIVA